MTHWLSTFLVAIAFAFVFNTARAAETAHDFTFESIDGGELRLADWSGQPILVVNSASLCAFTPQYEGLQRLYDDYRERGLVVLAVPSDDFRQELDDAAEVKEFCELTYGLDMPMADISHVRGDRAHPFYRWLADAHGVQPRWNFNKVLIDLEGRYAGHWGASIRPMSRAITQAIEAQLTR